MSYLCFNFPAEFFFMIINKNVFCYYVIKLAFCFLEFYPFLDVMWALDLALVFRKIYDDNGCRFWLIYAV